MDERRIDDEMHGMYRNVIVRADFDFRRADIFAGANSTVETPSATHVPV
jgi:hypothetical protein